MRKVTITSSGASKTLYSGEGLYNEEVYADILIKGNKVSVTDCIIHGTIIKDPSCRHVLIANNVVYGRR